MFLNIVPSIKGKQYKKRSDWNDGKPLKSTD